MSLSAEELRRRRLQFMQGSRPAAALPIQQAPVVMPPVVVPAPERVPAVPAVSAAMAGAAELAVERRARWEAEQRRIAQQQAAAAAEAAAAAALEEEAAGDEIEDEEDYFAEEAGNLGHFQRFEAPRPGPGYKSGSSSSTFGSLGELILKEGLQGGNIPPAFRKRYGLGPAPGPAWTSAASKPAKKDAKRARHDKKKDKGSSKKRARRDDDDDSDDDSLAAGAGGGGGGGGYGFNAAGAAAAARPVNVLPVRAKLKPAPVAQPAAPEPAAIAINPAWVPGLLPAELQSLEKQLEQYLVSKGLARQSRRNGATKLVSPISDAAMRAYTQEVLRQGAPVQDASGDSNFKLHLAVPVLRFSEYMRDLRSDPASWERFVLDMIRTKTTTRAQLEALVADDALLQRFQREAELQLHEDKQAQLWDEGGGVVRLFLYRKLTPGLERQLKEQWRLSQVADAEDEEEEETYTEEEEADIEAVFLTYEETIHRLLGSTTRMDTETDVHKRTMQRLEETVRRLEQLKKAAQAQEEDLGDAGDGDEDEDEDDGGSHYTGSFIAGETDEEEAAASGAEEQPDGGDMPDPHAYYRSAQGQRRFRQQLDKLREPDGERALAALRWQVMSNEQLIQALEAVRVVFGDQRLFQLLLALFQRKVLMYRNDAVFDKVARLLLDTATSASERALVQRNILPNLQIMRAWSRSEEQIFSKVPVADRLRDMVTFVRRFPKEHYDVLLASPYGKRILRQLNLTVDLPVELQAAMQTWARHGAGADPGDDNDDEDDEADDDDEARLRL